MTLVTLLLILTAEPIPAPPMVSVEEAACQLSSDCQRGLTCSASGFCEPRPRPAKAERLKFVDVVPEGYHLVSEPRFGLLGAGLGMFLGAYVPWSILGTMLGSPENLIPLIGPAVAFRSSSGWFGGVADFFSIVAITTDVMVQSAGAIMIIVALAAPKRWLERDVAESSTPTISFAPTAPGADIGASVVGRF